MSSPYQDVDDLVRKSFTVTDKFILPDGEEEYEIAYGPETKGSFERLCSELDPRGLVPWLRGTKDECVLTIRKKAEPVRSKSRIPLILLLLTVAAVVAASLLEWSEVSSLAPASAGILVAAEYGTCVAAILVLREAGHRYAARRLKARPSSSVLLPGIPGVTAVLPSLGFLSFQRAPMLNRDRYFDLMVVGPLTMLLAAVVLEACRGLTSYVSSVQLTSCQAVNSVVSVCPINPSVLQAAEDWLGGLLPHASSQGSLVLSPVGDAAAVGFLLAFVSIMPMASFDGGHLASTVWGTRGARAATYLCVLLLIVFDTPFYWGIAIVVLLLAGRPFQVQLLDEVSGLSKNKRLIYLLMIALALMCVPVPQNLATLPL